jgi:hypothetical protein
MSSPRDRDGFEERPDEGSGWREPGHLGGNGEQPSADRPADGGRAARPRWWPLRQPAAPAAR